MTDEDVNKLSKLMDSKFDRFRIGVMDSISASEKRIVKGIVDFVSDHLMPIIDEKTDKTDIDRIERKLDVYIDKTVIDIDRKICSAGIDRHYEGEKILLEQGSKQADIWGGGIDLETKVIDFNPFINIRPNDNNTTNQIQNPEIRRKYEKMTKFFFNEVI